MSIEIYIIVLQYNINVLCINVFQYNLTHNWNVIISSILIAHTYIYMASTVISLEGGDGEGEKPCIDFFQARCPLV